MRTSITKMALAAMLGMMPMTNLCAQEEVQGFVHEQSSEDGYEWPTDKQVLNKLDQWQDQKFGVLMHWGLYSIPGIVESWSICSEDVDWISRKKHHLPYDDYKKWYWGLKDEFNPTKFDPDQWADMMQDAGVKYMIFTTKHHDGFCMYDSKFTDFSIAHGEAFKNNPKRDIARYVFDAFRKKNFMIGCYFSKPDWHCPWFWSPEYATATRSINYKKERHPEWWSNYQKFTQNQLGELTTDYGKLDILWLDGGWVTGEEVGLDSILVEARKRNPGLISVDRAIKGRNENYQTPERGIPDHQLSYPWESCITLSWDWGWTPNAPYKSAQWIINTLAEITAKGGCFALGIGPDQYGQFDKAVADRLHVVGEWLRKNGKAIYGTRNAKVYHDGNVWFTSSKDHKTTYAIYALPDNEKLPQTVEWTGNVPRKSIKLLATGKSLKFTKKDGRVKVVLPAGLKQESLAFEIK